MILLVVGGSGFLGREVVRQGMAAGHRVTATHLTRSPGPEIASEPLDVRDRAAVEELITRIGPNAVINTAYQSMDWATTADGAIHVALAAKTAGARLLHVSSDALFSGRDGRYAESARPDPVSPYGAAKAAAETAIMIINPEAVVARTSLIIGNGDSPTERFVHALAAGEATGGLFTDDVRCPVHVTDLAAALLELSGGDRSGLHHLAGADPVSRHELGALIARRDGLDPALLPTATRAGSGIPGPLNVRLDSTETQRALRTHLRGAREFLSR